MYEPHLPPSRLARRRHRKMRNAASVLYTPSAPLGAGIYLNIHQGIKVVKQENTMKRDLQKGQAPHSKSS